MKLLYITLFLVIGGCVTYLWLYFRKDKTYDGTWLSQGYGLVLDISLGKVTTYQVAGNQLIEFKIFKGKIKDKLLKTSFQDLILSVEPDEISCLDLDGRLLFTMRPTHLESYEILESPNKQDLVDFFYKTFEENYPFFDLYDEAWLKREDQVEDLSLADLQDYLLDLVKKLNDDHVSVTYKDEKSPYLDTPTWWLEGKARDYVGRIKTYINDYEESKDRLYRYGHLNEQTGYIMLASFGGHHHEKQAVAALEDNFENILQKLINTKHLILDLRFNRGGFDRAGLKIAGHFISSNTLVYKKSTYNKEDMETIDVYVQPKDLQYKGKIYILVSGATVSAAETFVEAMRSADIEILGSASAGFYSDMLPRDLGNGLTFSLSHQKYYSKSGKLLEGQKIQATTIVPLKDGLYDPALEALKRITDQ